MHLTSLESPARAAPPREPLLSWLIERFGQAATEARTTLDELEIDSLDWLELTTQIERLCGVRLDGEAVSRIETVGDLLQEVAGGRRMTGGSNPPSPLVDPEAFLGASREYWLAPLSALELAAARGIHALNGLLVHWVNRVTIQGRDHLPARGPCIIAPHHVSYLDAFVLSAALDFRMLRETYFAAWTGVAYGPLFRLLRRLTHVVPVDSSRGAADGLAYGAAVLRQGSRLIWFPEGKLSHSGDLLDLKPGVGILLEHYPVPVVPVSIEGTQQSLPPGRRVPRPGCFRVTFHPPLDPLDLAARGGGTTRSDRITTALHGVLAQVCQRA